MTETTDNMELILKIFIWEIVPLIPELLLALNNSMFLNRPFFALQSINPFKFSNFDKFWESPLLIRQRTEERWVLTPECNDTNSFQPLPACIGAGVDRFFLEPISSTKFGVVAYRGMAQCGPAGTPEFIGNFFTTCSSFDGIETVLVQPEYAVLLETFIKRFCESFIKN